MVAPNTESNSRSLSNRLENQRVKKILALWTSETAARHLTAYFEGRYALIGMARMDSSNFEQWAPVSAAEISNYSSIYITVHRDDPASAIDSEKLLEIVSRSNCQVTVCVCGDKRGSRNSRDLALKDLESVPSLTIVKLATC